MLEEIERDTLNRMKKVLVTELGIKEEEITLDCDVQVDLGADSLDIVEVIMALEDEFGIDMPDEEIGDLKTVLDMRDYIIQHRQDIDPQYRKAS